MKEKVEYFVGSGKRIVCQSVELGDTITPLVEHIFSSGQCHALALALHEILGWPIMGCFHGFGGSRYTFHYVLLYPRGGNVDIHGIRCVDYGMRPVKPETILKGRCRAFLPPALGFARHYAPIIAKAILEQHEAICAGKPKPGWALCSEGCAD